MSTQMLLASLFRYKAWADEGLLAGLAELAATGPADEYRTAARVFNHACIVDRIFVANLQRMAHGHTATGAPEPPALEALAEAVRETDRWYIDYIARLDPQALAENIDFTFTDGAPGRMSREEMLAHVATHAGYHRGEVGRILTRLTGSSPPDTFTGFLHQAEPGRRAHNA
ncbi:DinB family protein [Variovorax sp. UC74_104]|uniref:DinB family protein n=1 Tax=Variovorax sp. UC74_104 TaxID=3374555 RepID=UPI003756DC5E